MIACTDKGQPKNIKDKIREMIGNYIKPKKTIILAIMPARTDIEADIALDLIKEYGSDPLRFTLAAMAAQGRDIKLSKDRIGGYRNFSTKVLNACN